jgi:hypothetical protein
MKQMNTNCGRMNDELAGVLLDSRPMPAKVQKHLAECEHCQGELEQLKATMNLLDAWDAPEPNPYFLSRLGARMREEREAAPAGWFSGVMARLRARVAYGPGLHARPLAAMALTAALLVGGGAYLGVTDWMQPAQTSNSGAAVVHDLQILESNAQVLDQVEALSSNQSGD